MISKALSAAPAAAIAACCLAMPAFADNTTPLENTGGRYVFSKVDDGFVRLDTQTGEVSLCGPRTVGWACVAAAEDRSALENEITRLRSENADLKKDMLARGLPLPPAAMPEPLGAHDGEITLRLPSNADVDRVIGYVGRVWHRFVEALARAEKQVLSKS